jgi:hypothetical protein
MAAGEVKKITDFRHLLQVLESFFSLPSVSSARIYFKPFTNAAHHITELQ